MNWYAPSSIGAPSLSMQSPKPGGVRLASSDELSGRPSNSQRPDSVRRPSICTIAHSE